MKIPENFVVFQGTSSFEVMPFEAGDYRKCSLIGSSLRALQISWCPRRGLDSAELLVNLIGLRVVLGLEKHILGMSVYHDIGRCRGSARNLTKL